MRQKFARVAVITGIVLSSIGVAQTAAQAHPYQRIAYDISLSRCTSWGDNGERAGAWDDYNCARRNPNGYELWVHYTH